MSQKAFYLNDESRVTANNGAQPRASWPIESVGSEFAQRPVGRVRVYQDGDARPLFDGDVAMAQMVRTTMARYQKLDEAGLTGIFGAQVPDSSLLPLRRLLRNEAGGHMIAFDVLDYASKQPIDDMQYEVVVVLEFLEECPELEAIGDPELSRRIYGDALEANEWFLTLDIDQYRADDEYSVLNHAQIASPLWT